MDWFKMGTSQHSHNFVRNVFVIVIDDVRLLNASSSPTAPNVPLVSIDMSCTFVVTSNFSMRPTC